MVVRKKKKKAWKCEVLRESLADDRDYSGDEDAVSSIAERKVKPKTLKLRKRLHKPNPNWVRTSRNITSPARASMCFTPGQGGCRGTDILGLFAIHLNLTGPCIKT
jgi:hypothetical protein